MTATIFLGPSLALDAARGILDADYRPLAAHGDIYRAALDRPRAMGLIDGSFRQRAAVRHKEILWAMSQGIHVFGAASMGALRAAELHAFGMIGVGAVFADFRDRRLEDDDEVAVDHGPVELGFPPINDAMVDIRATLAAARREGVIGDTLEGRLLRSAKQMFYAERNYSALMETASRHDTAQNEIKAFCAWLTRGKVSRKREDAILLLSHLKSLLNADPIPLKVGFRFEHTEAWDDDLRFACHTRVV